MKKFAAALLVTLLATAAARGRTINVRFPKGRTTVILKGRTTGGPSESGGMDPVTYRLHARKGQPMALHLTSAKRNAIFGVWAPGMDPMDLGQRLERQTPQDGRLRDQRLARRRGDRHDLHARNHHPRHPLKRAGAACRTAAVG